MLFFNNMKRLHNIELRIYSTNSDKINGFRWFENSISA